MAHSPAAPASPAVSVLTAALAPDPGFLLDALESLRAQEEADWEWLIQLDGERQPRLPPEVTAEPRIRVEANGRQLGAAATRNRALVRARSQLVQNLDADDQLLHGALSSGRAALGADPELAFAFGRTVDLQADGTRHGAWREHIPFAPGRIEAGLLDAYWLETGRDPLPLSPIIWRRTHLFAYGGWTALSVLEDTALVLTIASRHPCFYIDRDTQLYRIHPGQMTAACDYRQERAPNRTFIFERLRALQALDGRGANATSAGKLTSDPADMLSDTELRRGM
jgi:hypothetical protein